MQQMKVLSNGEVTLKRSPILSCQNISTP